MTHEVPDKSASADKSASETIDGATGRPDPAPRRIDLSTLRDVRLEMAYVYRQMDAGTIATQDGTRRVYVLDAIAKVITVADIEKRLTELEERQATSSPRPFGQPARLN